MRKNILFGSYKRNEVKNVSQKELGHHMDHDWRLLC